MSLPHEPDERATLPVVRSLGWNRDSELLDGIADRAYLEREGIIPEDPSIPMERSAELVAELGMTGAYNEHLRATGAVYTCPDWCEGGDHPRTGIVDPLEGGPLHVAAEYSWGRTVLRTVEEFNVSAYQLEDEDEAHIEIYSSASGVEADEARRMAAALLNAADMLDKIRGEL